MSDSFLSASSFAIMYSSACFCAFAAAASNSDLSRWCCASASFRACFSADAQDSLTPARYLCIHRSSGMRRFILRCLSISQSRISLRKSHFKGQMHVRIANMSMSTGAYAMSTAYTYEGTTRTACTARRIACAPRAVFCMLSFGICYVWRCTNRTAQCVIVRLLSTISRHLAAMYGSASATWSTERVTARVGCCFPKGEGLRHPRLLPTIATAIATWLGTLSRSHSRQANGG